MDRRESGRAKEAARAGMKPAAATVGEDAVNEDDNRVRVVVDVPEVVVATAGIGRSIAAHSTVDRPTAP